MTVENYYFTNFIDTTVPQWPTKKDVVNNNKKLEVHNFFKNEKTHARAIFYKF